MDGPFYYSEITNSIKSQTKIIDSVHEIRYIQFIYDLISSLT